MTTALPADEGGAVPPPFDPALLAALVQVDLDGYLRDRAPDGRLAFWKAVALGYGGNFESLIACPIPPTAVTTSEPEVIRD